MVLYTDLKITGSNPNPGGFLTKVLYSSVRIAWRRRSWERSCKEIPVPELWPALATGAGKEGDGGGEEPGKGVILERA